MIPLYTYPTDSSWATCIKLKNANPTMAMNAVINCDNGPGASVDPAYTVGIAQLQSAGIKVYGYVHTSYALRAMTDVQADVSAWKQFYPTLDGIFVDEMATGNAAATRSAQQSYYQTLATFISSQGFNLTIGNPGTQTDPSLLGIFSTTCTWEQDGMPPSIAQGQAFIASNISAMPSSFFSGIASMVYITDQTGPTGPAYNRLPLYFADEVAALVPVAAPVASPVTTPTTSTIPPPAVTPPTAATPASITVEVMNLAGQEMTGYYVGLSDADGNFITSGFSRATFPVQQNTEYEVDVQGYGNWDFAYWQVDKSVSPTHSVNVGAGTDVTLTAIYTRTQNPVYPRHSHQRRSQWD